MRPLPSSYRLQGAFKPCRGGGAEGEGVRITRGILQTQVSGAARQVSCTSTPRQAPACTPGLSHPSLKSFVCHNSVVSSTGPAWNALKALSRN